jgi:hypothetical protein
LTILNFKILNASWRRLNNKLDIQETIRSSISGCFQLELQLITTKVVVELNTKLIALQIKLIIMTANLNFFISSNCVVVTPIIKAKKELI